MAENLTKTSNTNKCYGSVCQVDAGCETMWSLAQQFAYTRLATHEGGKVFLPQRSFATDYGHRARIIAATYARFYLELEDYGDAKKKGRYYWMALGAFASKTVACTLDDVRVEGGKLVPSWLDGFDPSYIRDGLGKGNFWLFQDIAATHWYYSYSPGSLDMCLSARGKDGLHDPVQKLMDKLPWHTEAMPPLNHLASSSFIKEGFEYVIKIEKSKNATKTPALQLKHLLEIAQHEQKIVLQPLMYDDPKFAGWVKAQRHWALRWASPNLELIFSHACNTDRAELKSVAPADTKLEVYESRMRWINKAAEKFHGLMQEQTAYMEGELQQMASWYVPKEGR
jgi:hypothetical protein